MLFPCAYSTSVREAGQAQTSWQQGTLLHSSAQMIVDTIELDGGYIERYARARFKNINYMIGDVMNFKPEKSYDLVLCSHVIEHIDDYMGFVDHLQSLSRKWVLFYAPWEEFELDQSAGHVNTIDKRFLAKVKAVKHQVLTSPAWGKPAFKDARCVIFVLPGTAGMPKPEPKPPLTFKRVARGIIRRLRNTLVPPPPPPPEIPTVGMVWEEMRNAQIRGKR